MTWFKVDDGLHTHRKWRAASKGARSLWTTAGSWSSFELTNGFIPKHMLKVLDGTPSEARCLVDVGLWMEVEGGGWQFHQWNEEGRQPTKESVLAERAAATERQKRAREKAREAREEKARLEAEQASRGMSHRDSPRDSQRSHNVSNGPPDPTRPVLSTSNSSKSQSETSVTRGDLRAGDIVNIWSSAMRESHEVTPTDDQATIVGNQARELLPNNDHQRIAEAARLAADEGVPWLDRFMVPPKPSKQHKIDKVPGQSAWDRPAAVTHV